MSIYAINTTDMTEADIDTARKAAIVEMLTFAKGSGVQLISATPAVTGSLTLSQIRAALAAPHSEVQRLVHEMVDAATIVMNGVGQEATFTTP